MNEATDGKTISANTPPWVPWAYTGTDDSAPRHYDLTSANCVAGLVVWMTLTASTALAATVDTQVLADRVGLTKNSVESIRALIQADPNAFSIVAQKFQMIGRSVGMPYPPSVCPTLQDLFALADAAIQVKPY